MLLKWSDLPLEATIITTEVEHLHLVPSSLELAGWEEEPAGERGKAGRLREKLSNFFIGARSGGYDLVFLDCPPSLGVLTATALTAATHMVVPVTPRLYSLKSMAMLGHLVAELHREQLATVKLLGILVTLYDDKTCLDVTLYRLLKERIDEEFGDFMFSRTIAHSVLVSEAEAGGKPVVVRAPDSVAGAAYRVLAEQVLERLGQDRAGQLGVFAGDEARR
jgi:chromosome partitioning protein